MPHARGVCRRYLSIIYTMRMPLYHIHLCAYSRANPRFDAGCVHVTHPCLQVTCMPHMHVQPECILCAACFMQ